MTSLYLHIPFCRRKCPYCDFFSLSDCQEQLADYHQLLVAQLRHALAAGWQGPFDTVFFGGGTPSLLFPDQIETILEALAESAGLSRDAEITLEANPATLSLSYLSKIRAAGVNRLSIGIQSFSDLQLQRLERLHDARLAFKSLAWAREAGFDNLSCDLMFALPHQTGEELAVELERLQEVAPEHVAIYGLSLEAGTPWAEQKGLGLPGDDAYATFYQQIDAALGAADYRHYEISNFARPGYECRHNLGYWRREACLGLGPGAHGFSAKGWGTRWQTPPDLQHFRGCLDQGEDPVLVGEVYDRQGAMAETAYLALRTAEGVDDAAFEARFGLPFKEAFPRQVESLGERLTQQAGRWFFTPRDWLLYDHLIQQFL